MAVGERPDRIAPAEHRRRVAGRHRHEVAILERAWRRGRVDDPGDLELGQQVAAAARRPVGPERDRDVVRRGRGHVRRPAVEQQVAERRPDDPDAVVARTSKSPASSPLAWIATSDGASAQRPVGQVERGEVDAGGRAEALGQVEDQLVRLLEPGEEVLAPWWPRRRRSWSARPRGRPRGCPRRCGCCRGRTSGSRCCCRARSPARS